jgi:dTDP-4-amino-4,6-dideoxygalactose transaminase
MLDKPRMKTNKSSLRRIYLSPPHMSGKEMRFIEEAFDTNWIAPVGPHIDAFEREFCQVVGAKDAAAVTSGSAAIHLALRLIGVGPGDEVLCSGFTFIASVASVVYLGGKPIFIDSDRKSWNMDPCLLAETLEARFKKGKLPKAVILVHLYGQSADIGPVMECCKRYDIPLIEDAAEALGATYKGKSPGTFGLFGVFSFNGNKIITTSNGGILVSQNEGLIREARFLANQARDDAPHYEHSVLGYNYRLSNVLAGIGRGQLLVLKDRVEARRRIFEFYKNHLGDLPGVEFMPEAPYGRSTRWLTCLTIDPEAFGKNREQLRQALEAHNIEARPLWKPMHLQPVFRECEFVGKGVSKELFEKGLCLPSGSNMSQEDLNRVVDVFRKCGLGGR